MRRAHRWRILLAHDASASTCNALIDAIEGAVGYADIYESSSVDDARDALRAVLADAEGPSSRDGRSFDLCLVCLDLPPAPAGGVRLAQELVRAGFPVVLITRSLRWIPASATALHALPWIPPDATIDEVRRAAGQALAVFGDAAAPASDPAARAAAG